jgi:hypothetical protein
MGYAGRSPEADRGARAASAGAGPPVDGGVAWDPAPAPRGLLDPREVRVRGEQASLVAGAWRAQDRVEADRLDAALAGTAAEPSWIREKESLVIQGLPGVGKTHLEVVPCK